MLIVVCSIVYVAASFFLIFVVMIQKGEGGGLGGAFGGGAVDTAFGAKADLTWKRATALAATLFFVLAIVLGILQSHKRRGSLAGGSQNADAAESTDGAGTGVSDSLKEPGMEGASDDETGTLEETGGSTDGSSDGSTDEDAPEAPVDDAGE